MHAMTSILATLSAEGVRMPTELDPQRMRARAAITSVVSKGAQSKAGPCAPTPECCPETLSENSTLEVGVGIQSVVAPRPSKALK